MDVMQMLAERRTYRRFIQDKQIPQDVINEILTAQRCASSAANLQPLRYVVVKTPEAVEQVFPLVNWAARLPKELGTPKDGEHPTLFIVVIYEKSKKTGWTDTDAGLAISNMTLAAWSHGVGSCIMGSIDREQIRKVLDIEERFAIHSVIAFGYPAHQSKIVDMEGGDVSYFLDENHDYCVPKRSLEEVVRYK